MKRLINIVIASDTTSMNTKNDPSKASKRTHKARSPRLRVSRGRIRVYSGAYENIGELVQARMFEQFCEDNPEPMARIERGAL